MAEQDIFEREILLDEVKRILEFCEINEQQFKSRAKDVQSIQRKFLKLQTKIERSLLQLETFDRNEQLRIRNQFSDIYYAILTRLDEIKKNEDECRRISRASFNNSWQPAHGSCINKLPILPLPSFAGESTDWPSYYDLYRSIVHNNDAYTEAEKFRYLLLTLKNEPYNLIKSIPITDENYDVALNILIARYENKRAIASKHLDRILDIESCSEKSNNSLRNLLNIYHENIKALEVMRLPTEHWSFILLNILLRKIPTSLRKRFELSLLKPSEIPKVELLVEFLEKELTASEIVNSGSHSSHNAGRNNQTRGGSNTGNSLSFGRSLTANAASPATNTVKKDRNCVCCNGQHLLTKCNQFLSLSPNDRYAFIKNKDVCFNCLSRSHTVSNCSSSHSCKSCQKRHHTLIHFPTDGANNQSIENSSVSLPLTEESNPAVNTQHAMISSHVTPTECASSTARFIQTTTVLLSTALIDVCVGTQTRSTVRCIVDTGSQASFITEACSQRLGMKRRYADVPIYGIGDKKPVRPKGIISCSISPRNAIKPSIPVEVLVLPKLIPQMPSVSLPRDGWSHIKNLNLADPTFHTPQPVEMLLGADILSHILLGNVITGSPGSPIAMNSIFGYLLLGKLDINCSTPSPVQVCFSSLYDDGDLKKFWELESVPEVKVLTPEERLCESIFESSYSRDVTGRYTVALPRKPDAQPLGESKDIALARFHKLEHRLEKNPSLKTEYHACLQEYLELKHMEPVSDPPKLGTSYYIPHHCVIKESSQTTRTRVVFDASCKSSNGTALNDILLTGPKLHQDIVDVILKFRVHGVALTADIKQMYRNILVRECDRDLQRILWRTSPQEPIREYRLRTVTFGVSSSPYLALRTIRQLACDEASNFPLASKVLLEEVFVDDVVSGDCDETKALVLQRELIGICKSAGFELRKWHSNSPAILAAVQVPDVHGERREEVSFAPMDNDNQTKVLGLQWNPQSDQFTFSVQCSSADTITKRTILSQIAKIYDPTGWLSPVTVFAKHLMQLLWISGVHWDERPPNDIVNAWTAFVKELPLLSQVSIPRQVFFPACSVQLHGFCDASSRAYAACLYVRLTDDCSKQIRTFLLLAKTRVAPISPCLSIPRLELMAAVMLSKLIEKALHIYRDRIRGEEVYAWSDSSIVLAWLRSPPYEWKTFVSNRTSEILSRVPSSRWAHVSSENNPSDAPSRGMLPSTFLQNEMWFHGPQWLREESAAWPIQKNIPSTSEEKRNLPLASASATLVEEIDIINRFSNLNKLVRVTSYVYRFYNLLKSRVKKEKNTHPNHITTVHEYNYTLNRLIYLVQHQVFQEDFKNISQGKHPSNQLRRLDPFIDEFNFLRVGGRLHKSLLSYESKHQLILPKRHPLTNLIIDNAHITYLHAGTQSVQYLLLQKYWILSSRDIIRKQLFRCVRCFRTRPVHPQPAMAPLPAARLRPERPFIKTSVDYAGPFYVRANKVRNAKVIKCYVAVFVCMSVKAIHLELVSELTTEAFLAALHRFTSRRGLCTDLYSDCGRNFVGCNNYLKDLYEFLKTDSVQCALNSQTLQQGITWHFQPPYAAHFGGLHESGVRGFKKHLYRVLGTQVQTYDEMHTLLCQIEAILNSRPLCVVGADASDPLPLTPAHFLVGGPLMAIPDVCLTESNPGRLLRWRWVQQCVQHFWKRWSREYLHEIQQRSKWYRDCGSPIRVGDIVVVSDDNLPPLQWKLARVHELHPGLDNKVRVVTLQAGKSLFKRAVVKLCKLPLE